MSLRLVAIAGKETVDVGPYRTWTVGRAAVCDLPLDQATVSRRHAEVALLGDRQLRVRDLGSTNGTFLNGRKISEGLAAAGDRVAFGSAEFAVEEGGRERPPAPRDELGVEETLIGLPGSQPEGRRQAVVLFSDIRGFTALSEHLLPDQIAALLNDYFAAMVEIVDALGGTLDKLIGDALMATWDDPGQAMRAAVRMQRGLARRNAEASGGKELQIGIGLNAGEVFAGSIGNDYTVVGDTVNVAALLCAAAGPGEILAAETLYAALEEPPPASPLRSLPLKGREQPVAVREVRWRAR